MSYNTNSRKSAYYPPINIQELSLEELKQKFIKYCGKANGDVSVCSRCLSPCPEGKRAIQLVANSIYNDPPIPLYGGKTLIEKAREENIKRKEEKIQAPVAKKAKDGRIFIDDWYDKAMSTSDPVAWIMDAFHISKTKAKQKIYGWRNRHPEVVEKHEVAQETKVEETKIQDVKVDETKNEPVESKESKIEMKLDSLMKLQEEHKKAMLEYQKLYEEAKKEYETIKQKIDVLCNAMDIMNE